MRFQTDIITVLLVLSFSLVVLYQLYLALSSYLSEQTEELDIYVKKFSEQTKQYLIPLGGSYSIRRDTNTLLYVDIIIENVGTLPLYYRYPIQGVILYREGNATKVMEAEFAVDNASSAFLPKINYRLYTIVPIPDENILPYRVTVFINGVELWTDLKPISWPLGEIYFCYTCGQCQATLDSYAGPDRRVLMFTDIVIDRDPCINLWKDYNGITLDCMLHTLRGSGSETTFLFDGGSNISIERCRIRNVDTSFLVNNLTNVVITSVENNEVNHVMYISDPFTFSFSLSIGDIVYGDRKMYLFRPSSLSSISPFLPLSIWVKDYTGGVSIDAGGSTMERVYPIIAILESSNVGISNFYLETNDPYGVIIRNSSNVSISSASLRLNTSTTGIYSLNSDYTLSDINIVSTSPLDMHIIDSNLLLGNVTIR